MYIRVGGAIVSADDGEAARFGLAAPPAVRTPPRTLVRNDAQSRADAEVSGLQTRLNEWRVFSGEPRIGVTGFFRADTQAAVLQFQRATGLVRDGAVGAGTRARLALVVAILASVPDTPLVTVTRASILRLLASAGFASLGTAQLRVLDRLRRHPAEIDGTAKIRHLSDLLAQPGFESLAHDLRVAALDLLAAHPADVHVADVLTRFAGTTNFRKLEPAVQRTLLNLVKRYAGKGLRLGNLRNLVVATNKFDALSKESRGIMIQAQANHPDDHELVNGFRRAVHNANFPGLPEHLQSEALRRVLNQPRGSANVDNIMSFVKEPAFDKLALDVQDELFERLRRHYPGVLLNPTQVANILQVASAFRFEKIRPELRTFMLDVLGARLDNRTLAAELRDLAEHPRAHQHPDKVRQAIMEVDARVR